jgi:CBS domain-containing protein
MLHNPLVSGFASSPVVTVTPEDSLEHAYELLVKHAISAVAVVGRDNQLTGVVSRRDLLSIGQVTARLFNRPTGVTLPVRGCGDVMSHPVVAVPSDARIEEAARLMIEHKVHRVFLTDANMAPVGVFSTRDVMAAIRVARIGRPISEIMSPHVVTVPASATLGQALLVLEQAGVAGVIVVDDTLPVGVFGETQAIAARELAPTSLVEEVMDSSLVLLPPATPLFRACSFSISTAARRICVVEGHRLHGVVTGMDFCAAFVASPPPAKSIAGVG